MRSLSRRAAAELAHPVARAGEPWYGGVALRGEGRLCGGVAMSRAVVWEGGLYRWWNAMVRLLSRRECEAARRAYGGATGR